MQKLSIPAGGHILVCDGGKALLLQNAGDNVFPNLKTIWTREIDNPPTREQGTDRPARVFESVGTRRSGAETPDYHDRAEEQFARDISEHVGRLQMEGAIRSLVVAAPPRMLADLRRFFAPQTRAVVSTEIDKDLVNRPVHEIEHYLTAK